MWNFMQIEQQLDDRLMMPMVGPGGLTYEQARAEVQWILDRGAKLLPLFADPAARWKAGSRDDTVYAGPFIWTVYEHSEGQDPRAAALVWLEDLAQIMRSAGVDVGVPKSPWA